MILSASRRTDIPAFYSDWFFERLREGHLLVRNPFNTRQVGRVSLSPAEVNCIVFWTKNPAPMLDKLHLLSGYAYYFQFTLNAYGRQIEKNTPLKEETVRAFKQLARSIGSERVVWRYDPIILCDCMDRDYHVKNFEMLAGELDGCTESCIISFVDQYKKNGPKMDSIGIKPVSREDMLAIGEEFSNIGRRHGLKINTCCEGIDLSGFGIGHASCIDGRLIQRLTGKSAGKGKDRNQRELCGCIPSLDIGAYNTCSHGCLYCYASFSGQSVKANMSKHDPLSPMLVGNVLPGDNILERSWKR